MLQPLWAPSAGPPNIPAPPPRAAPPPAPAAALAPAASSSGWTEHTAPDGRKYYYHKAKGSAWEKPEELKTEQEKVVTAAVQSKWKEYTSAGGKKYYFNTETRVTQWDMPEEMKAAAAAAEAKAAAAVPTPAAAVAPAAPAISAAGGVTDDTPNAAAVHQFMQMIDDMGVTVSMSWEEAMKRIINNQVYRVLPTLAERKAAFMSWQEGKREEAEEEDRKRTRQIKINFLQMLKECEELTSRTRYGKVLQLFGNDPRWFALDDELEREELYEEYSLSLERKESAASQVGANEVHWRGPSGAWPPQLRASLGAAGYGAT